MNKTMRIEIGTALYNKLVQCVDKGGKWALEGKLYNVSSASRIDNTDYIRVVLKEVTIK